MKRRSILLSVILLLVASMFLSACSKKVDGVILLTGGTGGTYYPLGGEMGNIIENETGISVSVQTSNASADNVELMRIGEAELAFVQTDVVAYAVEGINMFEKTGKVENIQAIGSLYPETIQIVTRKGSGINSVEDLAGKAVSVGAPGSGTFINAEQILEIHGMTMDDIKRQDLTFDESTDGIQDGNIDAAFLTAGTPTGSVAGLSASVDIDIVPIAQDKIDELIKKYPHYAKDFIASDVYGLDEDIHTVAVLAMLAVSADLDEKSVYEITKAVYDNASKMTHDKAKFIKKEDALNGIGIDLHPGAAKYFKEEGIE